MSLACSVPVVTIDGRTATGKSTLADNLSANFGYSFLDSGLLYRAATWQRLKDAVGIPTWLDGIEVVLGRSPDVAQAVVANGHLLSRELWAPEISDKVSMFAADARLRAAVREVCVGLIASNQPLVITGRDMARTVAPSDAGCFELVCEEEVRRRRLADRDGESKAKSRDGLESDLLRDYLQSDPRSVCVDTTSRTPEEVFAHVVVLLTDMSLRYGR